MPTINLYEAKTHLSRLVDQAAGGTDVIIARAGKPVARLTRLEQPKREIRFGLLKGRTRIAADLSPPSSEATVEAFEGRR